MPDSPPITAATREAFDQAVDRGQAPVALELLRGLCLAADPPLDDASAREIVHRLAQAGWLAQADPLVSAALEGEEVPSGTGCLWARLQIALRHWNAFKRIRTLLLRGPLGEATACSWIRALIEQREPLQLLRLASVGEHWLRRSPPAWGEMAAGLRELGVTREGHFWTWGWQEMPELTARDLLNVAEILRANAKDDDAAEANRAALDRAASGPIRAVHACWLAADDVRRHDLAAAEIRLPGVDPAGFTPDQRFLYTLVTAAVSVGRTDAARRPEVLSDARQSVDAACRDYPGLRRDPARIRLLRDIAQQWTEHAGLGTRLWAMWRCWRL